MLTRRCHRVRRKERDRGSVARPGRLAATSQNPGSAVFVQLGPDEMWTLAVADKRERERIKDERR